MNAWFLQSYKLTKDKYEWLVVPAIILFSFLVGMLASVALGVAISTFIFVGSFYKTGVVKFIDTGELKIRYFVCLLWDYLNTKFLGLLVRSTVERNAEDAAWLGKGTCFYILFFSIPLLKCISFVLFYFGKIKMVI